MKLLFETWRRFLKEDIGYFGELFVEFKNRVDAGEHPLKVAREILQPIGIGSTRVVFGFPDNKTHLLKIVNVEIIGASIITGPGTRVYGKLFVDPPDWPFVSRTAR